MIFSQFVTEEGREMVTKQRADQIAGGVFLIGLGLIFFTNVGFWPWILFVLGASSMARGMAEGQAWYSVSGGLWLMGLGLVFLLGFNLPLLLILVGVTMLIGYKFQSSRRHRHDEDYWDKPKNEDKRKNEDHSYI
jgi:hypothetical protein